MGVKCLMDFFFFFLVSFLLPSPFMEFIFKAGSNTDAQFSNYHILKKLHVFYISLKFIKYISSMLTMDRLTDTETCSAEVKGFCITFMHGV